MKRILVLSFYYPPDLCAGSFRCDALVSELIECGAFVHVITTMPNRYKSFEPVPDNRSSAFLVIDRAPVASHKSGMLDQVRSFFDYYRKAMSIAEKKDYDLVVATSSRLFTAFLGARISRKKGLPLYLDIRDLFSDTITNILNPVFSSFIRIIIGCVEKYTFKTASKINLVSLGFKAYFKKNYKEIPLSFFTNGIDDEFMNLRQGVKKKGNAGHHVNILYAGNIGEGQGLHKIIPGMADSLGEKVRFKIIGDGGRVEALQQEIADRQLNNVEVLPPVNRTTLIDEYQRADVLFLHLNDYEAFRKVLPSKLFEYGAMDKPILAGLSGYSRDFVEEELTFCTVFPPADIDGAIEAFNSIEYDVIPRVAFVKKFSRKGVMKEMARQIIDVN